MYKFRGTTVSFGGTIARLRSARVSQSGSEIDITNSLSADSEFESGFATSEVSITVIGSVVLSVGSTGALTITWTDGNFITFANVVIMSLSTSGDVSGAITSDITFKKTMAI